MDSLPYNKRVNRDLNRSYKRLFTLTLFPFVNVFLRYIKMGDKEVEYHPEFRLILHTKLANPHYKPEMQAQTTLINFTVTREGLEDQLLADVVRKERPDLEETKANLTQQMNQFTIKIKELEDTLLARLSAAGGNFLGDYALVENLENTKRTAAEIEVKVAEGKTTEVKINEAREQYRPAAARSSLLYFILNDLNKINPIYQFSLKVCKTTFLLFVVSGYCSLFRFVEKTRVPGQKHHRNHYRRALILVLTPCCLLVRPSTWCSKKPSTELSRQRKSKCASSI